MIDRLGLTDGQSYPVHILYAHREASSAVFHLRTNIELSTDPMSVAVTWPCD